jgi:hypothetical protein
VVVTRWILASRWTVIESLGIEALGIEALGIESVRIEFLFL